MKPLTHAQTQDLLQLAADGLLQPGQRAQLDAHLAGCPECAAYASELDSLQALISSSLNEHWGQPDMPADAGRRLQEQALRTRPSAGIGKLWLLLLALPLAALLAWQLLAPAPLAPAAPTETQPASPSATVASLTPTVTPSSVASATASVPFAPTLFAVPAQTTNCREGNSSQFDIVDTLYADERYEPLGRGRDELWLQFRGPVSGVRCWAYIGNLSVLLNDEVVQLADVPESVLPYLAYPATPTIPPTPEPTSTPAPQCSDGLDNDGDGYIDMQDRECSDPTDNNEAN